jgi:hypothetical protein
VNGWAEHGYSHRQAGLESIRATSRRPAGRPERPIDPNAGPVARFAESLRQLRREQGNPAYRELAAHALFAPSVLSTAAGGFTFPSLRVTLAFVRACGGDPVEWQRRWEVAAAELAGQAGPGGPALDLAGPGWVPRPAQMPPSGPHFTGRATELGQLLRLSDPGQPARAGAVVITGPVGIGKSALAVAAAHQAGPRYPDGQLYADLSSFRAAGESPGDLLGRLLMALGVAPAEIPACPGQRAVLYRSALAARRVLVVLDDAISEAEVRPLLAAAPACVLLVTSRRRLAGLDTVRRLTLDTLPPGDSQALVQAIAGRAAAGQDEASARLGELCGHLPMAVRIAATRLAGHRGWTARDAVDRLLGEASVLDWLRAGDTSVRRSLHRAYQALDPAARRAFRRLGHGPGEFGPGPLAGEMGISASEAEQLLDQLVDGGLLQTSRHSAGYHLPALFAVFAQELHRPANSARKRAS